MSVVSEPERERGLGKVNTIIDQPRWSCRGWGGGEGGKRKKERGMEGGGREYSNSNSKTLFYKDCSLGSFKNLSNNLSLLSY